MIQPPLERPGARLREMWSSRIVLMPGAYNPLTARLAFKAGANAAYLSGGAMANAVLGAPDISLTTLDEIAGIAARSCQAAPIPIIADADTGFGEVWNVRRTVIEYERAGLAGLHLEDQVNPKRCGHLDGKELISPDAMSEKIRAAVSAKRDDSFVIIARTDARGVEGMSGALDRAKAYVQAGADAIFPEGLADEKEFGEFRAGLPDVPLLANMTEFGKTPLISANTFESLGYQMVIFPVSALRVTLKAVEDFYAHLLVEGTQDGWLDRMMTRKELYELVGYSEYEQGDAAWRSLADL
ncbi:MAG: methylisocitrate lyase [Fimbriimonadaceae bacterium]|nr:methylisocitrate lyase [Fimbriimonadaceae bacterium]